MGKLFGVNQIVPRYVSQGFIVLYSLGTHNHATLLMVREDVSRPFQCHPCLFSELCKVSYRLARGGNIVCASLLALGELNVNRQFLTLSLGFSIYSRSTFAYV